jgi:hypothetical protein
MRALTDIFSKLFAPKSDKVSTPVKPVKPVKQVYSCKCSDETVFYNVLIHESFDDAHPKPANLCMYHIGKETAKGNIVAMV